MNHDPIYDRLRELSWRRPLTGSEQAELRAWFAAHPEAQAEWEGETDLNAMLDQLPDAPVPSNFTARVLQAAERETEATARRPVAWWNWRWRALLGRAATAAVVVGLGWFAYHRQQVRERTRAIEIVAGVPEVKPEILEDFEAIRSWGSAAQPDEDLLALLR